MNKKIIILIFIVLVLIGLSVVIRGKENGDIKQSSIKPITIMENKEESNMKMYIKINEKLLTATLENNSSSRALIEKLKQNDLTIEMEDYANFEKVGSLGFELPRNDQTIATKPGDIILYQGNTITIYYDSNTWSFTKLGQIDQVNETELKQILGKGNVTVVLSLKVK